MSPLQWLDQHIAIVPAKLRLPFGLFFAICSALVLTVISVSLYLIDGDYKLDLSRPGFEQARSQVVSSSSQIQYDTTSPVTPSTIDDFLKEYDSRAAELGQYGSFNDQALDNPNLQINFPQ